ncbi:MAG: hypothetical protein K2N35_16305 [Muribaculaceae bacterium]|nr:hypothetical protein [Muribaculaceae bacterium]
MTKETLCTYEQSSRLKRLGFDWPCWSVYHEQVNGSILLERSKTQADNWNAGIYISAPTRETAHRWLIEKENLFIAFTPQKDDNGRRIYSFNIYWLESLEIVDKSEKLYDTYGKAMSDALDKAIICASFINHNNKI